MKGYKTIEGFTTDADEAIRSTDEAAKPVPKTAAPVKKTQSLVQAMDIPLD